ncbi:MAG: metal-dependent hydrolase [Candidatus Competibacterales bacterium]|nr:metal-dependent hydrolase [Candidatus Competibacterales bacterium]
MDSLTQAVLGAAVGEAVLGRRMGRRAALFGAIAGTLPDLDVLADPWLSTIQELALHRGLSHSLLFVVIGSPLFGALFWWLGGRRGRWRDWSLLAFWCFATHIALDCLTVYGTQVLQPFSDYRAAVGSVFIIDPFYTVPLLLGLLVALCLRPGRGRRLANGIGLGLSSLYLAFGLGAQWQARTVFAAALDARDQPYQRLQVTPTPFNTLLWIGIAEQEDGHRVGHYSLLDDDRQIEFEFVPHNRELLADVIDQPVLQTLVWFSDELYRAERRGDEVHFIDLHLPRSDAWLAGIDGDHVFRFRLLRDPEDPSRIIDVEQLRPPNRISTEALGVLLQRVLGGP